MNFLVVIEQGATSWGAYAPDLPGCGAAADTRDEVLALIREAIEIHLEMLAEEGGAVPLPVSEATVIAVKAA